MTQDDSAESESGDDTDQDQSDSKGIFVTSGMDFRIESLSIRVSEEGAEASLGGVSVRQDVCHHWLGIALEHLLDARQANEDLLRAHEQDLDSGLGEALDREFRSGMQAIVAAAVSLDGLHAAVKERIELPDDQIRAWRKNGTARWKQQAEVFRRGFDLGEDSFHQLRDILSEISRFRGWAVHPPAEFNQPILREDIERGVERRYVAFGYDNARGAVRRALSVISQLAEKGAEDADSLAEYCEYLVSVMDPLVERWQNEYPDLTI